MYNNGMSIQQLGFTINDDKVVFTTKTISAKKPKQIKNKINTKYQELYNIYSQLYDLLGIDLLETQERIFIDNLVAYPEDRQAEVNGTQFLSVDERIRRNYDYLENRKKEFVRAYRL